MQFVETQDLKKGMRLARPIYSKKGVLLFDRNSRLTAQAIDSVRNFGLLGVYVLDPAEPLPPMTEEDLEFERFQTMAVFSIQEELNRILSTRKQSRMNVIASTLIRNFGHLEDKINFYQNLRSKEDYVFRHSLNVAILCTMITHVMNLRLEEQLQVIYAAVVHDIGKLMLPDETLYGEDPSGQQATKIYNAQVQALELIEGAFSADGVAIRRICTQALRLQYEMLQQKMPSGNAKLVTGAKILLVANRYDEITAMKTGNDSGSEVKAIQEFCRHPESYDPQVVKALVSSIKILSPGVSIELSTGEKALVLVENQEDILRPVVLSFRDNSVIDLSLAVNEDIHVVDIMKTLDNRYIMDTDTLSQMGYRSD